MFQLRLHLLIKESGLQIIWNFVFKGVSLIFDELSNLKMGILQVLKASNTDKTNIGV